MRKLLLFLLVFGAGLGALLLVDRSTREGPSAAEVTAPAGPLQDSEDPVAPARPQDPPGAQATEPRVELEGDFEATSFNDETGRRELEFRARLDPLGAGRYEAHDLAITTFDPVDGKPKSTTHARRGLVGVEMGDDGGARVTDEGRVELFEVEVVLHSGGPVAPLTIRAEALDARLERETFHSVGDAPVELWGEGLRGSGRDLAVDGTLGRLELGRGGNLRFAGEGGSVVVFSTTGDSPLVVERVGVVDADTFEATADQGGRLLVQGDPPTPDGWVEARSIRVLGKLAPGGLARIERVTAEGEVRAQKGGDRFSGETARAILDPSGSIIELVLEEEPRWRVTLEEIGTDPIVVDGSGEGPMSVSFSEARRFEMRGQSRLSAEAFDLSIDADDGMTGSVDAAGSTARFAARGDVRLTQGDHDLRTEELDTTLTGGVDGAIDAVCRGRTTFRGEARSQDAPYELIATERVELEKRGDAWRIPLAQGVEVRAGGPKAFRASAGTVRDFEWGTYAFAAEDGVTYDTALGKGEAVRARALGRDELELYGLPGSPARFDLTAAGEDVQAGSLMALTVRVQPDRVEAEGDVLATIRTQQREYDLACVTAQLQLGETDEERRPFVLEAQTVQRLAVREGDDDVHLVSDQARVTGRLAAGPGVGSGDVERAELEATGAVEVRYAGALRLTGVGERFVLTGAREGRLETSPGRRVSAWGRLPLSALPYEMTATRIEFDSQRIVAPNPHIFVRVALLPIAPAGPGTAKFSEAKADVLTADAEGLRFDGNVLLSGTDQAGYPMTLAAGRVQLRGDVSKGIRSGGGLVDSIESFEATGGFDARYVGTARARGERMFVTRELAWLQGAPAELEVRGKTLESTDIQIDLVDFLVTSERGVMRAKGPRPSSLEFAAIRPVAVDDETMLVFLAPVYTGLDRGARADWAVFWLDQDAWRRRARRMLWGEEPEVPPEPAPALPEKDLVPNIFRRLSTGELSRLVNQVYLEGEVEVTEEGVRTARADAAFLDLVAHEGWMEDAEVVPKVDFGSQEVSLRTRADEIRIAADGSLRANGATLTACDQDLSHYEIETGDLVMDPREDGRWRISANNNVLRLQQGLQVPLPPIGKAVLDDDGSLAGFENDEGELISFHKFWMADSGRFGTSVGTSVERDAGQVGKGIGSLFGFSVPEVRGKWDFDGKWLSSRGPLLTAGLKLREAKKRDGEVNEFWLDLYASGIPDTGQDRGMVRVPESGRDTFRGWYRARGRYPISKREWIDLSFSLQSDAGVQSEFFESDFVRYEERENFVHWRRANGAKYYASSAKVRLDDFRNDVEELPAASGYRGVSRIADLGPYPLLWGTEVDVAYLRRRDGDEAGDVRSPFEPDFDDVSGDDEILRIDHGQKIELPVPLADSGMRATPFMDARVTAWDQGEDGEDAPARAGLFGGVELSSVLWKKRDTGRIHEIAPSASFRSDLATEESDDAPEEFDGTEDPFSGKQLRLGVRSRWWKPGDYERLDLELTGLHAYDRSNGADNLNDVNVLGEMHTKWGSIPVAFQHDATYDVGDGDTRYSRFAVGFAWEPDFVIELNHTRGLDDGEGDSFEAAGLAARWTASPKWEFEYRGSRTLVGSNATYNSIVVRRFSHDFLVEIVASKRQGEGGATFGISVAPLLGWSRSRVGRLGL